MENDRDLQKQPVSFRRRFISFMLVVVIIAASIVVVYTVPWRVHSYEELPKVLGLLDHWKYYVPTSYFLDVAIHNGELPLWNPLVFCGTPFAANPNSFVFYPLHIIRGLLTINPTPMKVHIGWVLMIWLHLTIAGVGTFYLAREHKLSYGAGFVGTFVFLFSADMVRRMISNWFLLTLAWLPIILILLRRAYLADNLRQRLIYGLSAGLFFGLSMLGGSPHMIFLMSMTIVVYAVLLRLLNFHFIDFTRPMKLFKMLMSDLLVGILIFIVGLSVSAASIISAKEFSGFTERGNQVNKITIRNHKSEWLLDLFVNWGGDDNMWRDYRMVGLSATLLALAAIAHRKKRDVLLYALFFYIFLDCSLGAPRPFATLSLLTTPFRLNDLSRAMLWACFPLGIMAAFGTDAIARRWQSRPREENASIYLTVFIAVVHVATLSFMLAPFNLKEIPKEIPKALIWGFFPLCMMGAFGSYAVFRHSRINSGSKSNSTIHTVLIVIVNLAMLVLIRMAFSKNDPSQENSLFSDNNLIRALLWSCFPLGFIIASCGDSAVRFWQRRSTWKSGTIIISLPVTIILTAMFGAIGYYTIKALHGAVNPAHAYMPLTELSKKLVVIIPGITLGVIVLSGWLPLLRKRQSVVDPPDSAPTRGWIFKTVSIIIPMLLIVEMFIWSAHFVPYLINWKGNGRGNIISQEILTKEHEPWSDNYRGCDPKTNVYMSELKPSINGYDPMYIKRVQKVLRYPDAYGMRVGVAHVFEDSLRGNLFLKRSFWLARQYVKGPLPNVHTPFPATTTVFLPEKVSEDVENNIENVADYIAEVDPRKLPKISVSEKTTRIPVVTPENISKHVRRNPNQKKKLDFIMPPVNYPEAHSTLRVHYKSSINATITTYFRELPSNMRIKGKSFKLNSSRDREEILDIPLPKAEGIRTTLSVEMRNANGKFDFLQSYILSDLQDEDNLIKIIERKNNSVEVEVGPLPDYRILTFLDAYFPGWEAYVDSEPTEIMLANDAFKAVLVPPGTHKIKFVFRPKSVYAGMTISFFGTLLTLVAIFVLWCLGGCQRNIFSISKEYWDEAKELEADESVFMNPDEQIEDEEYSPDTENESSEI